MYKITNDLKEWVLDKKLFNIELKKNVKYLKLIVKMLNFIHNKMKINILYNIY